VTEAEKRPSSPASTLVWHDGGYGYRCSRCYLFVCVPKENLVPCPNGCTPVLGPIEERIYYALTEAGFDESDAETATRLALAEVGKGSEQ